MRMLPQHVWARWLLIVSLVSALGVTSWATALEVGEPAPDFTLASTMGGQISLSQFRGKQLVLLEFHVNDFGAT